MEWPHSASSVRARVSGSLGACANKVDGIGIERLTFPVDVGKSYFVFVDGALPTSLDSSLLQGNFRITFAIQ